MFCCFSRVDVGIGEPKSKDSACQASFVTGGRHSPPSERRHHSRLSIGTPTRRAKHHPQLAIGTLRPASKASREIDGRNSLPASKTPLATSGRLSARRANRHSRLAGVTLRPAIKASPTIVNSQLSIINFQLNPSPSECITRD